MRLRVWWALLVAGAFSPAGAAPLERDLGQGLRLYRVHEMRDDAPPRVEAAPRPPCVVDLRYARADAETAAAFAAWLKARAAPRSPVFLLVNADTAIVLLDALKARERGGSVIVIGPANQRLRPDLAVTTRAEDERRAYDALENGATVAALVTENPEKVRNDEASLSRDRLADASADAAADANAPKGTAPPIDAALQRAVHLHRALVALRKL